MNIADLKDWFGLIAVIISLGTVVYAFLTARSSVNSKRINSLDERVSGHGSRLQDLESEVKHLPNKDMVMDIKLAMEELNGKVGRLEVSLGGFSGTVRRIDDYLMKERG